MAEGRDTGGEDLQKRVEMLGLIVVVRRRRVGALEVAGEERLLVLGRDDVLVDAVEEGAHEGARQVLGLVPSTLVGVQVPAFPGRELLVLERAGLGRRRRVRAGVGAGRHFSLLVVHLDVVRHVAAVAVAVKICFGLVASIVVLHDGDTLAGRRRRHLAAPQQQRAEEDVIPTQGPVLVHQASVQVREEEENAEEGDDTGGAEDAGERHADGQLVEVQIRR